MSLTSPSQSGDRLKWKSVITNQDWASIVTNLCIIVALIIFGTLQDPETRPYLLYDATISYPYNAASTVPYWAAIVAPFGSLIVSLLIFELGFARRLNIPTISAVTSLFHFIFDFIFTFATNALLTETSKLLVARFRPDWLSRCQPTNPGNDVVLAWALPSSDNPVCTSTLSVSKLEDGRKSFPSGHASTAFALGVYVAGYVLWAVFYRTGVKYARSNAGKPFGQRLMIEMGIGLSFIWILAQLGWAWGVAVSRVIDNKHHPSDVIGGSFLGTVVGTAYILRAIPRHYAVMEEPKKTQEPLLPGAITSADTYP